MSKVSRAYKRARFQDLFVRCSELIMERGTWSASQLESDPAIRAQAADPEVREHFLELKRIIDEFNSEVDSRIGEETRENLPPEKQRICDELISRCQADLTRLLVKSAPLNADYGFPKPKLITTVAELAEWIDQSIELAEVELQFSCTNRTINPAQEYQDVYIAAYDLRTIDPSLPGVPPQGDDPIAGLHALRSWCAEATIRKKAPPAGGRRGGDENTALGREIWVSATKATKFANANLGLEKPENYTWPGFWRHRMTDKYAAEINTRPSVKKDGTASKGRTQVELYSLVDCLAHNFAEIEQDTKKAAAKKDGVADRRQRFADKARADLEAAYPIE